MQSFQPGDTVLCIKVGPWKSTHGEVLPNQSVKPVGGKMYTVEDIKLNHITLCEITHDYVCDPITLIKIKCWYNDSKFIKLGSKDKLKIKEKEVELEDA